MVPPLLRSFQGKREARLFLVALLGGKCPFLGQDSGWEGDHVVFLYKGFVEEGGVAIIEKSCFSMGSSSSCQYLRCYVIILPNAKVVLQYAIVRQKHLEQSFCCTSN